MPELTYPAELPILPVTNPANGIVTVPGSKSITNRALVLAALASRQSVSNDGTCTLVGALRSEDTEVMIDCLRRLGFRIDTDWEQNRLTVHPNHSGRLIPAAQADLFVANSGTTMRFLAAMVSAGQGEYRLDGVPRMRERPIEDLLEALRQLGVDAQSENNNGCPPIRIRTTGLRGGEVRVRADVSSQFVSGLMMAAAYARGDVTIRIVGRRVSEPYIRMTEAMMGADWLITFTAIGPEVYTIPAAARIQGPREYPVEPDASAASYFWAAAAITGGAVTVRGFRDKFGSLQGDLRFVRVLEEMGCQVLSHDAGLTVRGGPLRGVDVDMNDISDTVMTLAAVACFADGPTTIRNVAHIRHKETDRIAALATELRKLGAAVEEHRDGLTITPRPLHGCALDTYNDHRMAMSLALIGLKVPGVVIRNPGCVAKTYPGFWQDFERLRCDSAG
ncbi:MAG: 3-phosphoshikimate 1-carboxyvinyltransferase [Gemmataceae bacterium]|nr:3-phosphoshikimate 1-carboxyvinyltransferase [Gemmata sp.]MDW8196721.1 3-phosphoshikimate 1-carboxyvinyltransferase [Gemmataceae bacterium]